MLGSLLLLGICTTALADAPERKVSGNTITSARDPAVRIDLPASAHYVGADRWVLYGMADCELHAWVEAGAGKNVNRLYWVQFEQYLPTRPELHHTYDSPRHARIGGLDFYVDTWVQANEGDNQPGSDGEHIRALLKGKGYTMPAGMMVARLVHLLDAGKRKELMVIYAEDLGPAGFTPADLKPGGRAHAQWPGLEAGLIGRAEKSLGLR